MGCLADKRNDEIAAELDIRPGTVAVWRRRFVAEGMKGLRKEVIQLQRHRSWCVSTDPQFAVKLADIIGLYLNPPQNALGISIDEKPSIQALEQANGFVYTSSGKIIRGLKSTYNRHGTINLFAALNAATGAIQSKITVTQKRPDFQAFLDEAVTEVPIDREIHVILDNYYTQKERWR